MPNASVIPSGRMSNRASPAAPSPIAGGLQLTEARGLELWQGHIGKSALKADFHG
jgi:hypothetical protein